MTMHHRDNKGISYVSRLLFACLIACAGLAGLYAQAPLERAAKQPVSDLGQKAIRRMISGKSLVVHAFGFQPFARPLTFTDDDWTGRIRQLECDHLVNWALCRGPATTRSLPIPEARYN